MERGMEKGTVKWFDEEKGYGFIQSDVGRKDYFVHSSDIMGESALEKGARVEFEIIQNPRGPKAAKVRVVNEESEV